jgi:SsrA-binding protein
MTVPPLRRDARIALRDDPGPGRADGVYVRIMAAARKKTGAASRPKGVDKGAEQGNRRVASNRRARHDYEIIDTVECGLVLQGSEVKSLREGRIALQDSYARIVDGEAWLFGVHIPPYVQATGFGAHDPDRRRKLLLHRRQIDEWMGRTQQQSLTMVPLSIYFKDGKAKVELALARGRHRYDKRRAIADRDAGREAAREARAASRAGAR